MSNFDFIKSLDFKDMAEFLFKLTDNCIVKCEGLGGCYGCPLLYQEVVHDRVNCKCDNIDTIKEWLLANSQ